MKLFNLFAIAVFLLVAAKAENYLIDVAPAIQQVPTSHKVVALTFDDGPLNITTPEILSILREKQVKATFFVVGERVEQNSELLSQEIAQGHEVGNHTFDHRGYPSLIVNKLLRS